MVSANSNYSAAQLSKLRSSPSVYVTETLDFRDATLDVKLAHASELKGYI
jgi:hypothetical protein